MSEGVRHIYLTTPPPPPQLPPPSSLLSNPTSSTPSASAFPPHPSSSSTARSTLSSVFTARNSLIALTSVTAVGVAYYIYRRSTKPSPRGPQPLPSPPPTRSDPFPAATTSPPPHTLVSPPPHSSPSAPPTFASTPPLTSSPSSVPESFPPPSHSSPSLLSRILHRPPHYTHEPPPPAPTLSISPAQATAALLAETRADVLADTGIALGVRGEGEGEGEEREEVRVGLMGRLRDELEEDEKEDAAAVIAPMVRRPMTHYHPPRLHHPRVPSSLTLPQGTFSSPVEAASAPTATSSADAAVPLAVPTSAEEAKLSVEAEALAAVSPVAREVPVVLGSMVSGSASLQSPTFTPIFVRTPVLPSLPASSPLLPSVPSTPVLTDASLALSPSASTASPLGSSTTAVIPSLSASTPSTLRSFSTPPTYFAAVPPAYATMPFTAADGSPHILAFIADPASSLLAVAAQSPASSLSPALIPPPNPLTASPAAAPPEEGGAVRVEHLLTRSTLLVELLAVLVLLIAVLAAAVDARWLLPLAPIVAYVLFVCAHAVRTQPNSSVLFPVALFPFLYHDPPPTASSSSTSSSSTSAFSRALLPAPSHATMREVDSSPLSPPPPLTSSISAPGVTPSALPSPTAVPLYALAAATLEQSTPSTPPSAVSSDAAYTAPTALPVSSAASTQTQSAEDERQEAEGKEEKKDSDAVDAERLRTPPRRDAWREKRQVSFGHGQSTTSISDDGGAGSGEEKERAQPAVHTEGVTISPSPFHPRDSASTPSSFSSTASSVSSSDAESDTTGLVNAASSLSPSPTPSASPSLAEREASFFPPEPVADLSGSSTSSIAVKFTYRQRWEDVVQAFWDLTSPDWERTGHSLGLADSRLATPPSGTTSGMPASGSPRSGGSAGVSGEGLGGVEEVSHGVTEMWRGSSSASSLYIRRQLTVHTKVPGVVKKVVGPAKRVVLEERALLDAAQRTFRLQVNNSRFRRFLLVHETRRSASTTATPRLSAHAAASVCGSLCASPPPLCVQLLCAPGARRLDGSPVSLPRAAAARMRAAEADAVQVGELDVEAEAAGHGTPHCSASGAAGV